MTTLFGSIFVFVLIIALHELGHFAMAKAVGIKVNEYSIGMGPALWKRKKGETQYSLRALPIGGYVAMEGEENASSDPRSFNNASVPARMAVVASGAAMNFVLAFVAFTLFLMLSGYPTKTVDTVVPNSPAQTAGLRSGDEILAVNGREMKDWEAFSTYVATQNEEITVEVRRDGKNLSLPMTPVEQDGKRIIGVKPRSEFHPGRALYDGLAMTGGVVATIFDVLGKLFSGAVGVDNLSGPVGVVKIIGDSAKYGFASLMFITGYISANLGFMNLLPIPALDGGKLLFLLIEAIRGKAVDEKLEMGLSLVGITLLFGLMIYVTIFGDIARFIR